MSKKGENIYKRKDGRWEARYIRSRAADGKPIYGYCYARSYREAREKLTLRKTEQLRNDTAGAKAQRKNLTDYCNEWLRVNSLRVKESTNVKYASILEKHISPALGNYRPEQINSLMIEEFSRSLLIEKGLSPKTAKDILVVLKSVLTYAGRTGSSMRTQPEIPYPRALKKEMRVLTFEEQKALTEYLLQDMDTTKFGVLLSLLTGLRIGEICALRWTDISIRDKVMSVGSTMQRLKDINGEDRGKTRIVITEPKSASSARIIPLSDYALELCKRFVVENPEAYVLTGTAERYMEPRTLQYRLERYTKDCGLSGVHFHTLRHSFATRCVEVDFEIKSLSEILGHSSPKVTLERYVHSSLELKRANMDKLSAIGF